LRRHIFIYFYPNGSFLLKAEVKGFMQKKRENCFFDKEVTDTNTNFHQP